VFKRKQTVFVSFLILQGNFGCRAFSTVSVFLTYFQHITVKPHFSYVKTVKLFNNV